jgi:hypothetical protein
MCKIPYEIAWPHSERHCPNLVFYAPDGDLLAVPVEHYLPQQARIALPEIETIPYKSLAHLWSEWNGAYVDADFPRLIVRFEDTIYHAEEVFRAVAECSGVETKRTFRRQVESAKDASQMSMGLLEALAKNGKSDGRLSRMIKEDIDFAKEHLNPDLMKLFGYASPVGIPDGSFAAEELRKRKQLLRVPS